MDGSNSAVPARRQEQIALRCNLENPMRVDAGLFGNGQVLEMGLVIQGVDVPDRPDDGSVSDINLHQLLQRPKWLQVVDCAGDAHQDLFQVATMLEPVERLNPSAFFEVELPELRTGRQPR